MGEALHAIKAVVRRTGLSAHVIRVWEKRYGAVKPERTATKRRRYSEEEIQRLGLLHELTRSGYSIGVVAKLPTEALRELSAEAGKSVGSAGAQVVAAPQESASLLDRCLAAVKVLDAYELESTLKRGLIQLGAQGLLQRVIAPLAQRTGELWREGTVTAAHEHFASSIIRVFLGQAAASFAGAEGAPVIVVGTPSGQLHELGALLAAAMASNLGWRVTYLGPSLPAAELAGAARQNSARAVALSLVYPEDDSQLEPELSRLRELLPQETVLLVGGRAAPAYADTLERIGAVPIRDLAHLGTTLDDLRRPARR